MLYVVLLFAVVFRGFRGLFRVFSLLAGPRKKSYHGCVYVVGGWTGGGEGHSPWLCVCSGWVDWGVTRVEL